jgi:branched-chain amino acid transport system permease protein
MRASVDSRPLALLHGARPDRSAALAWVIGCSLAALAGILIAPTRHMNHLELTFLVVNAYAAAMFGRLRSLPMTFLGAVILGLADSYAIGYIPTTNQYFNTFRFAIPSVLLSFVLLALPSPQLRMRTGAASKEDIPRPGWVTAMATAAAIVTASVVLANVLTEADALRASKILGLGLIALSLVPLTGFAGQVSLCQMSFAGIGAVVMAHQGPAGEPFALVLVAIICGIVGAIVAIPSIRLSGLYLALSTAAFAVFLDSWVFRLPAFDLGPFNLDHGEPYRVQLFNLGVIPVRPLDLPVIDTTTNASRLVVLAVIFAAMYLLVVGVRRSSFGERLLALKDSPAAAATLGMNVTLLKLGVFALSAAMAGVGGALWAGTQGSVSPERFALVESLPLLLLAVVGGIGTAGGALFAGLILGGLPIAIGIWPWLGNVNRLLPGTMGVAMGRNPNGAVRDISSRYGIVREVPFVLAGLLATVVVVAGLAVGGSIDGWTLTIGLAIAFVVWPQTAEIIVARRRPKAMGGDLEWAGVDRPFTADDLRAVNAALALEEVSA